ncbi:hypothetical protein D3C87_1374660 [compost metagenome]
MRFQSKPAITKAIPVMAVFFAISIFAIDKFSNCPINIPRIPVPIAGNVLKIPSGSQVLEKLHKCPFKSKLSNQAARLVPFSKLAGPTPGTGTKAIRSQYPVKMEAATISCVFKFVFKYKIEAKK